MSYIDIIIGLLIVLVGIGLLNRQSFGNIVPIISLVVGVIVILVGLRIMGVL